MVPKWSKNGPREGPDGVSLWDSPPDLFGDPLGGPRGPLWAPLGGPKKSKIDQKIEKNPLSFLCLFLTPLKIDFGSSWTSFWSYFGGPLGTP